MELGSSTCRNRSSLWLYCDQSTPGSSRCQSLPGGRPTAGHTWAQTLGAPWTGPTRTYNEHTHTHTQKHNSMSLHKQKGLVTHIQTLTYKHIRYATYSKVHQCTQTQIKCIDTHTHTYTQTDPVRAEHLHGNPHHTGGRRCHTSRFTMETLPLDEEVCVLMCSCVCLCVLYYCELWTVNKQRVCVSIHRHIHWLLEDSPHLQ